MATELKRTDLDFNDFRRRLVAERKRLLDEHKEERADMAEESADSNSNEPSYDTNEPGDAATQLYDRGRDEALDENTRAMLEHIDHALQRMEEGTYGICEVTGAKIPVERLRALPWATMTVEAAERVG